MTAGRYTTYRRARTSIASGPFTEIERELLLDAAEGLLLSRSLEEDGLVESTVCVSSVIERVVRDRRLDRKSAGALTSEIRACGPSKDKTADQQRLEAVT